MALLVVIGIGISSYVNQKSIEAEQFGFDSAGELIGNDALVGIANFSIEVRKALNLDEP